MVGLCGGAAWWGCVVGLCGGAVLRNCVVSISTLMFLYLSIYNYYTCCYSSKNNDNLLIKSLLSFRGSNLTYKNYICFKKLFRIISIRG